MKSLRTFVLAASLALPMLASGAVQVERLPDTQRELSGPAGQQCCLVYMYGMYWCLPC